MGAGFLNLLFAFCEKRTEKAIVCNFTENVYTKMCNTPPFHICSFVLVTKKSPRDFIMKVTVNWLSDST